jgi:phenylacetate-CoA ligase
MSLYENIFKRVLFPVYEGIFHKRNTMKYLHDYNKNLSIDKTLIVDIQWHKLRKLLQHCIDNVPYYKQTWAKLGFQSADDFKSMEDFEKLPILTKQDIRDNYEDLIATNYRGKTMKKTTGGSTGEPMDLEFNSESEERRQAVMWRGYDQIGAGLGVKTLYLWGADTGKHQGLAEIKYYFYHAFFNRKFLNSYKLSEDNMMEYIESMNQYKSDALVSFVNPLFEMAKYILTNNIKVHSPKTIVTGAEALHEPQRKLIEKAFNCKVYNTFGCREVMLIASECQEQDGFHINVDHLVVETVDDNGKVISGENGELLLTDLHNYGMPFIRYANGDMAITKTSSCACGNPMPMFKKITGRKLDVLRSPEGHLVSGEFFISVMMKIPTIDKFQIVQKELSIFDVNLIIGKQYQGQPEEDEISEVVSRYTNNSVKVRFNYVDKLGLTSSGKLRVTVSKLKE